MLELLCPQCKKTLNGPANRLVKDSCGHQKCRLCLLLDEQQCLQCCNDNNENDDNNIDNLLPTSVIKFEYNHTGVITCNGVVQKEEAPLDIVEHDPLDSIEQDPLAISDYEYKEYIKKEPIEIEEIEENTKHERMKNDKNKRKYQYLKVPNYISVFSDPKRYKCNICSKEFATRAHIKYHAYCTGEKTEPFQCTVCSRRFKIKAQLNVHLMIHTSTKPHKCNLCQKGFREKRSLNRHLQSHTSFKPYVCSDCGKALCSKYSLEIHNLIHRGEKPYKCTICNASFSNSSNLNRHKITHTKDKIHMCDECGKRFKRKLSLVVHRRSHLRIRPFKCDTCKKSFVNNKDLQRHQLTHLDYFSFLETKAFTCSICNTKCRRKDNLYRHVKNAHPGKKIEPITSTVKQLITKRKSNKNDNSDNTSNNSGNSDKPIDNPNAINVITASPVCKIKTEPTSIIKTKNRSNTVINGPLKLAFKTSAFKNNYNINRDGCEIPSTTSKTYDIADSVNIFHKILSRHSPPPTSSASMLQLKTEPTIPISMPPPPPPPSPPATSPPLSKLKQPPPQRNIIRKVSELTSNEICQKILSTCPSQPVNYETYEHKKRAINIKFKLPANYSNLQPLKSVNSIKIKDEFDNSNEDAYTDLQNVSNIATSVIVNSNLNQQHWKKAHKT